MEISYGNYQDLKGVVAEVFDSHPDNLWVEMELAKKMNKSDFGRIVEMSFDDYKKVIHNHWADNVVPEKRVGKYNVSDELMEEAWENEFVKEVLMYISNYSVPVGDLQRPSSYGIVKRDWGEDIVLVDYGLDSDVQSNYYS